MTPTAHLFDYNKATETSGPGAVDAAPDPADYLVRGADMSDATCSVEGCERPPEIPRRGLCRKHYMRLWKVGALPPLGPPDRTSGFDRLMRKVDASNQGCWLIPGADPMRHATINVWTPDGRKFMERTYRVTYSEMVGPIPDGHHLHHKCFTPGCCNPAHLQAVTPEEHAAIHAALRPASDTCVKCGANDWRYHATSNGRNCRPCQNAQARDKYQTERKAQP